MISNLRKIPCWILFQQINLFQFLNWVCFIGRYALYFLRLFLSNGILKSHPQSKTETVEDTIGNSIDSAWKFAGEHINKLSIISFTYSLPKIFQLQNCRMLILVQSEWSPSKRTIFLAQSPHLPKYIFCKNKVSHFKLDSLSSYICAMVGRTFPWRGYHWITGALSTNH